MTFAFSTLFSTLSFITWDADPDIYVFHIFGRELPVRWYGVLFMSGFLIGQQILYYIYKKDNRPAKDVDTITIYVVVGTIIGARLGHYLFYEWETLVATPWTWFVNLVTPPFAGLASHGATIGILLSIYLYARSRADQSFLWVVDRVVITVSLGGFCIRMGNFINSEIYGKATSLPWGVKFIKETNPDLLPVVPRHPTQLYEALWCIFLFLFTFYLWKYKRHVIPTGTITGWFMILLFSFRFLVEFLKNNQVGFEDDLTWNMGQILSLPVILLGIFIVVMARRKKAELPGT